MRERQTPRLTRTAAAGAVFLGLLGAIPFARADDDEHLPPKAKAVAEKFEAFKKTASPVAVEAKRKQVVAYLGSLLKIEASEADLEGALAVKDLMDRLSGKLPTAKESPGAGASAKPAAEVAPKPATKKKARLPGRRLDTSRGGHATPFRINSEATRKLAFDFDVVAAGGTTSKTIRCEIGRASDDSGDAGLHYELVEPGGRVAKKGFLQSSIDVVTHETTRPGTWTLVLRDEDTSLEGHSPGNSGSVRVVVMPGTERGARETGLATRSRR